MKTTGYNHVVTLMNPVFNSQTLSFVLVSIFSILPSFSSISVFYSRYLSSPFHILLLSPFTVQPQIEKGSPREVLLYFLKIFHGDKKENRTSKFSPVLPFTPLNFGMFSEHPTLIHWFLSPCRGNPGYIT